jgi:D-3-phosphoglycerate dehydrogenase / 2-oxoglutarate reductase
MNDKRILITPRSLTTSGHPALARFEQAGYQLVMSAPGQQPSEEELLRLLPGCVGYLAGVEPITRPVLEQATGLKAISRNGTGVNNIDLAAAQELNIAVLRVQGANARGVAELAIGLTLALVRHVPISDRALKQSVWARHRGIELVDRTMGLVGCGQIGQIVAEIASALGMKVLGYDPVRNDHLLTIRRFRYVELEQVLASSDVVSLHCPPLPDGQPLITRQRLASMKDGAYLVNTARAELLDDQAVLEALNSGKLAGMAIDAFRKEPPGSDPLVLHEKTIAVPHIGSYTDESIDRAVTGAVENLLAALHHADA